MGGNGGNGIQSSITGTATYYGGGGGGGVNNNNNSNVSSHAGSGGLGGGGRGSSLAITGWPNNSSNATSGDPNTGGGGGGTDPESNVAGNGGSGIVIIRYQGSPMATGGTINQNGDYTIHSFTQVGSSTLTFQREFSGSFNEGSPVGTVVGNLTATDSDTTNLTYALVSGDGNNDIHNSSFTISGSTLLLNNGNISFDSLNYDFGSEVLDNQNSSSNAGAGGTSQWQSFTVSNSGLLSKVSWKMANPVINGSPQPVKISVFRGQGDGGSLLGQSQNLYTPSYSCLLYTSPSPRD